MQALNSSAASDAAPTAVRSAAEPLMLPHPSSLGVWGEADSSTLICRQVQDVTHDVKTFLFESAPASLFQHEPGQFVTLQLRDRRAAPSVGATRFPRRRRARSCWASPSSGSPAAWCRTGCTTRWHPEKRISADGPCGGFTLSPPPFGEVPIPVRGKRRHARHVHDANAVRPRVGCRHRVRAQCTDTVRHHLPPRARDHREHGAHRARRAHVRTGLTPGTMGRTTRLPQPATCSRCWQPTSRNGSSSVVAQRRTWPRCGACSVDAGFDMRTTTRSPSHSKTGPSTHRRHPPTAPRMSPRTATKPHHDLFVEFARSGKLHLRRGRVRARRRLLRRTVPRVVLRAGHVRHLQDDGALRHRGHAAQRWHPSPGDHAEQDLDLLLETTQRPDDRRLNPTDALAPVANRSLRIGDAVASRNIHAAILDAYRLCNAI